MKIRPISLILFAISLAATVYAQDVIHLYPADAATPPSYPEKEYYSNVWHTEVVTNVTQPTLTVFRPSPDVKNGSAIVICPGGGFMALSISSEGTDVARYLAARGMTAFVLKYRLAHTGEDATAEFGTLYQDKAKFGEMMKTVVPQSVADGLAAVTYVRQHASDYGIATDRVGIIGFSAGGTVAAEVAFRYRPEGRPAFAAPIYSGGLPADIPVPTDAPPMFIAAATDDNLGLAPRSIDLYQRWTAAHKSAELHMYVKGGHGFGMHIQHIPTDNWIDRFAEWLTTEGFLTK
ncbi:alpha/beta hydrolase [Acidicapsa dinghuensis]|uniref:Alpha/beta hydrolase n=1 Tax=Acidicapsa dinghuensis TaxID=2218256 RepID=A0ABW1EEP8_9BACT|nr:alpha/beta hydrolase [Acidicapsa dinghuensis]